MNVSLDLSYFITQIKNKEDQEFITEYYNHFQAHLECVKKYIELKKKFYRYIRQNLDQRKIIKFDTLQTYQSLSYDIDNSIKLIENDAIIYKEKFRNHLFYLIKK